PGLLRRFAPRNDGPRPGAAREGWRFGNARLTAAVIVQAAASGLLMGLIYALVAAGLSLIFGLMDVVNFAHGELLMLGLGVAIYRLLIVRALSVPFNRGMVQIFVTFGLAIFIRGAAQFAFGGEYQSISQSLLAN